MPTMTPDVDTNSLVSPSIKVTSRSNNLEDTPFRLGVLASGSGSNFEAVAQAIQNGQLNARIQVLIYNNPDAYAAVRAADWNIPAVLLNHRDYNSREDLDAKIVQTFKKYNVDWIVMAGWMRIVTQVLIDAYTDKIINIHPSLLPSFKGARAVEQALSSGVKITGCTVHIVRLEVDDGPILMQAAVPVFPNDTTTTLHQRIQVQEHRILPAAISLAIQKQLLKF
ncbi:MAG: phosphoribosylglycinamide formyltransferase [Calothrix sp. C42_A2020_038]|nr:phosphoribosylglycinamide formyltransferase [Calothrix sp. C42_A2020_038]